MSETMKAIRLNAPNDFEYTDVPKPAPAEYEVLCRVESVSICGTDPHIFQGDFPGFWPQNFPLIPGHEWSGVVVELGKKADCFGWKVGDRVCGIANLGCGHCKNCMEGRFTLCLNYGNQQVHRMYGHISPGAYAEFIAVNIRSIAKIPDEMDFDTACIMDTLSKTITGGLPSTAAKTPSAIASVFADTTTQRAGSPNISSLPMLASIAGRRPLATTTATTPSLGL